MDGSADRHDKAGPVDIQAADRGGAFRGVAVRVAAGGASTTTIFANLHDAYIQTLQTKPAVAQTTSPLTESPLQTAVNTIFVATITPSAGTDSAAGETSNGTQLQGGSKTTFRKKEQAEDKEERNTTLSCK